MPKKTSIKVSSDLRDRLAVRAQAEHTTLAGALSSALEAAETQLFWATVRAENSHVTAEDSVDRAERDATLGDDLTDAADDALGADGW